MGFFDTFKGNQYKTEIESLQKELEALKASITPEMQDALKIKEEILRLQIQQNNEQNILYKLENAIDSKNQEIQSLDDTISQKKKQIVLLDDEILVQEFGLYEPQFDFASALDYKEALTAIRATQKELIKNKQAVTGNSNWEVNGSASKGKKMVSDTQKL